MTNERFVNRYRKYGEEQPYWKAGVFKIHPPFIHYKWLVPEMVQAVFMRAICLGTVPVLQEVLGVSYGVVLSMVIINGLFYSLHVLLGDPAVPEWITPAIPIITAFPIDGYEVGPECTQALITMQLILGFIFLVSGITGISGKIVHLVPNPIKAGALIGDGLATIIGEMGETGRFWTYPVSITVGMLVACFCLFSPIWASLCRKYKAIDLIGRFGMLPATVIGIVLGPIVKEIAVPAIQLWSLVKTSEFGNIWNRLSPSTIGWSNAATWIAAIPTAIVVYIIAFGDFVASGELLHSADEVRQDEKIDFSASCSNVISDVRNVVMAPCCPYTQTCGPLRTAVTATVSRRYKGDPKAMEFIYSDTDAFHWCTFICVALIPISSLLQPVLPVALSLTLIMQGFICTQLAMNVCRTDIERGIYNVMGVVLAIQSAAWGLAMSLILFSMLFEGKKEASG